MIPLLLLLLASHCGMERQLVKTSADSDAAKVESTPVNATVAQLNALPAPSRAELDRKTDSRFPAEMKTYKVVAYLEGFKLEADEDFHIVLEDLNDPKMTMVAEMIAGECAPEAIRNQSDTLRASWQARFGKARPRFKKFAAHKIKIEITGVGFFDFLHGQTGVAKNGFELHRVLTWREVP